MHTPKPWGIKVAGTVCEEPAYWQITGAGGIVGDVQSVNFADARLISAAPDLLDALQALMALDVKGHALADRLQFSDAGRALLDQCRAAIAKGTT